MPGTSVIVAGARTPIGRLLGGLKDFSAAELGGFAIKGALEKAGVSGDQVDYIIMGQVIQAGAGQNPARMAGVKAGIPMSVPSITINKVCLSGVNAIAMADQMIRAGEHEIVVAGGMESMTNAPHFLPKSREGVKFGDATLVDSMAYDALFDQFTSQAMGLLTEECNAASANLTREEQDEFAAQSHQKAAVAWKNGVFDDEVVPVTIPQRKGDPIVVSTDEGVRGVALLGEDAHRLVREVVVQGVEGHRVDELHVAVLEAFARLRQQVRSVGHRLHPAGDDDVVLTGADQLVGERDRVDPGQADLVDRDRRNGHRNAGLVGCLAGRDLAGAGLDDLAEDDVLHLVTGDPGLLQGTLDRHSA
jgi:acetyl-CoA acetyltransferase